MPASPILAPSVEEIYGLLRGVIDPELGGNIVDLGMVPSVTVAPHPSGEGALVTIGVKLTIGGCPLRAQIKNDVETRVATHPGVRDVQIDWGEMTQRGALGGDAQGPLERPRERPRHRRSLRPPACSPSPRARAASARARSPSTSPPRSPPMGFTVGVLDADIWGFSVPRMLGMSGRLEGVKTDDGSERIIPNERRIGDGLLKVVSTGFLVDDEGTALMWRGLMLTKAVEQFLRDVHWGDLDYLLIDMPPGTGDVQMGLARMLPRTDLIIVTTPAVSAQKVAIRAADMARRSFLPRRRRDREHERVHVRPRRDATRCSARAAARPSPTRSASSCSARSRSSRAWPRAATRASPSRSKGEGPAADAFRAIAHRIVDRHGAARADGRLQRPPARASREGPRPQGTGALLTVGFSVAKRVISDAFFT